MLAYPVKLSVDTNGTILAADLKACWAGQAAGDLAVEGARWSGRDVALLSSCACLSQNAEHKLDKLMYAGQIGSASLSFLANRAEPTIRGRSGALIVCRRAL